MPGLGTRIGSNAHALALGKVALSLLDASALDRYIEPGLRPYTPHTIVSPDGLRAQLDDIRAGEVAFDREEFDVDFCCLAKPVLDARGRAVAALGLSMSSRCFDTERETLAEVLRTSRARPRRCSAPPRFQRSRKTPEFLSGRRCPANVQTAPLCSHPFRQERKLTMSRASITKAHNKIQELSWDPTFVEPVDKYPTDYTFEKAPKKDPLKQVLRSYFPMEEEKDNRVFGAMDGAIRGNMFRQVQERWMEWQKLFLSIIPFPEISAARAMPLAINAVPNPEVHNGLAIQMIDEVRHSTIQMNLKRLYMNHYIDPAGFDITEKAFSNCYAGTIGRQFGEGFITGDAITAANVYLTIVAETAFTNVLFVAMPGEAAANGDYLLPTVFHSVQSDESRHISNGYSIILMALADERNRAAARARPALRLVEQPRASSTRPSARSSSTARRTAARTATATPSRGAAGSTTTTTAATWSRWRSTA